MGDVKLDTPDVVRYAIASEWLRADSVTPVLGSVILRPHQIDAVRRLRVLLNRNGGALLCDEVGLGKTYVALALARSHARPLVVAPASLRDMWQAESARSGVPIRFASVESLSRAHSPPGGHEFVIVDEAHHFRTPSTARHRALTTLAARSPVLLVSATPLHNKRRDLIALLSLYLGSAAAALPDAQVAGHLVRRNPDEIADAFPRVRDSTHLSIPHDSRQLDRLLALPAPIPPRDGGLAAAMVAHTLVRLWASSDSALREGLRRRLARTVAIRCALETGGYPTARELRAWTYGDGSMQLGFTALLSPDGFMHCDELLGSVQRHEHALVELLNTLPRESIPDAARAEHVRSLRLKHPDAKIVAFSQFSETVSMFYRLLGRESGVAILTSRGARIASGPITRREVLARFAPLSVNGKPGGPGEDVSLLLATDLLSEGVNLQDAAVVIHLDLPWTAATLEQRVGRVARMRSPHREVFVYSIDPPAPSRVILRAEAIIRRKAELAGASIGSSRIPSLFARADAPRGSDLEDVEAIRRTLTSWPEHGAAASYSRPLCAAVSADRDGALVLVTVRGQAHLLAMYDGELSSNFSLVREIAALAHGRPASAPSGRITHAVAEARRWIEAELASDDAGRSRSGRSSLARRICTHLARCLSQSPLHERARYAQRIAAVQRRIQSPFTLGVEREIEELLRTPASLDELERVIGKAQHETHNEVSEIRAVLVLCRDASPREAKRNPKNDTPEMR